MKKRTPLRKIDNPVVNGRVETHQGVRYQAYLGHGSSAGLYRQRENGLGFPPCRNAAEITCY